MGTIMGSLYDNCDCGAQKYVYLNQCRKCTLYGKENESSEPTKCLNCKNQAKKGRDLCGPCYKIKRGVCIHKGCNIQVTSSNERYCYLHFNKQKSSHKQKTSNQTKRKSREGIFVCDVCGKQRIIPNLAKGAQKVAGGAVVGVFGFLTMVTGGLTAPLMLGIGAGGAALMGAADNYSTCSDCRRKGK